MPILLLLYPKGGPAELTAISLCVVCLNASSGSLSYARMKRIDFKSGLLFLTSGVPGAMAGAYLVNFIPRNIFNFIFGILLLLGAAAIIWRTIGHRPHKHLAKPTFLRDFVDAAGVRHRYKFNLALGISISFVVGVLSSVLGIGGGIIHVPAMANLLGFPVHIATATSQFILAVMTLAGVVVHVLDGSLGWQSAPMAMSIGLGAVLGAQVGAHLSRLIHGRWIMRVLGGALALVGLRVLILALN